VAYFLAWRLRLFNLLLDDRHSVRHSDFFPWTSESQALLHCNVSMRTWMMHWPWEPHPKSYKFIIIWTSWPFANYSKFFCWIILFYFILFYLNKRTISIARKTVHRTRVFCWILLEVGSGVRTRGILRFSSQSLLTLFWGQHMNVCFEFFWVLKIGVSRIVDPSAPSCWKKAHKKRQDKSRWDWFCKQLTIRCNLWVSGN